ncbi:MAG: hypothetical protein U0703_27260 [Anaerolineae bacterium]
MTENDPIPESENEPIPADAPADGAIVEAAVELSPDEQSAATDDWMTGDVDAALAAVASLSELMPEREAEAQARADSRQSAATFEPEMPMPPLTTLRRGQLGSVVPALLLIGFGAWLTLTTTGGAPPDAMLVAGVVIGGIVLTLLAQWARGAGRVGWCSSLLILLVTGVVVFSVQPGGIDLGRGYPLLAVAVGLAMVLAGFLARPVNPGWSRPARCWFWRGSVD